MIYSRWEQSTDLYTHHHILSCYFSYSWFMLLWSIVNLTKNLEALKDLTGRDWGQEKKGTTEDELAEWHHWLDGRESEWTPGVADGQGGLVCCDSRGHKESDTTEQLNWTELTVVTLINTCNPRATLFQIPPPGLRINWVSSEVRHAVFPVSFEDSVLVFKNIRSVRWTPKVKGD